MIEQTEIAEPSEALVFPSKDTPFDERLEWDRELAKILQINLAPRLASEIDLLSRLASEIEGAGKITPSTQRQYCADMKRFKECCDAGRAMSLPAQPEMVALFLLHEVDENGASYGTIQRMRAAISWA